MALRDNFISDVGPDFLTVTSIKGQSAKDFITWAYRVIEEQGQEEGVKQWSGMGYAGKQTHQVKAGIRASDEAIVMFAGKTAQEFSAQMPVMPFKVTRFDLQVTVSISPPDPTVAFREYQALKTANLQRKKARYLKYISSNTGSTLYVGKRTNAVMLRLYDATEKYKKGHLGNYWRYEVEYKKASAQRAYDKWAKDVSRETLTINQVASEFDRRGIRPGFRQWTKIDAIGLKATASTDKTRIEWLAKCVAPVVTRLVFNGNTEQVLHALKLNNIIR